MFRVSRFPVASLLCVTLFGWFCALPLFANSSTPPRASSPTNVGTTAGQPAPPQLPPAHKLQPIDPAVPLSHDSRIAVVRSLLAELVYIRTPFPMGIKGLTIKDGVTTPSGVDLDRDLATFGPSVKPGDQARISNVIFKDHYIRFEINGGPVRKQKWYQHISIVGANTEVPIAENDPQANARGSFVDLVFSGKVPDCSPEQLKALLHPVFDFEAKSVIEAYLETVPPVVKAAVQEHRILVGMNREMVIYAKGRPDRKIREKDADGVESEEWIYGTPPQPVFFVRWLGDEVVRLESIQVGGPKEVRTAREVPLPPPPPGSSANGDDSAAASNRPFTAGTPRPTLRRPGEEDPNADIGTTQRVPVLGIPGGSPLPPGNSDPDPGHPQFMPSSGTSSASPSSRR